MQNLLEHSFTIESLFQVAISYPKVSIMVLYFLGMFVIGIPTIRWCNKHPTWGCSNEFDKEDVMDGFILLIYPLALLFVLLSALGVILKLLGKLVR